MSTHDTEPDTGYSLLTQSVQAGIGQDPAYHAVSPPLYLSTTYQWSDISTKGAYDYGRSSNPNRDMLTRALVDLEGGAGGEISCSGMAALDLVLNLLRVGDLVIAPHDCYAGLYRLLTHRQKQGHINVRFIDQRQDEQIRQALDAQPAMMFIETPSNPLMRLVDIEALCARCRAQNVLTVVDNTFLTPVRQKPLSLGADIVIHSCTKFINGHSDVTAGAVIAGSLEIAEQLRWWANCVGVTGAPMDAWLALRGLRTLSARMDIQEANAQHLALFLNTHPQVDCVYYPGLETHTDTALARKQQSGPGAMLSFDIKGDFNTTSQFLSNLTLFQLASSLGGVESLICQPAIMTHSGMGEAARKIAGIKDNCVRISVGMETIEDLIEDFTKSFDIIAA